MNKFRKFLCALLFVPFLTCSAEAVTMRIGHSLPDGHLYDVFLKKFEELTEKYTDGKIDVKVFANGQLGTEDGAFKSLQLGTIDGYVITMSTISPHYSLFDVFALPYVFESMPHMQKVLRSNVMKDFFTTFYNKTRVYVMAYGVMDTRDLYNTKRDINSFKDFAGIKYRVPKNEVFIETFKAFGAEPIPLAWSETPTALQTGTVEGGDNGISVILDMKFYEMAKHLTVLDHILSYCPLFVSDRFMKKLTPELKVALDKAALEANEYIDSIVFEDIEKNRAILVENGMVLTRPDRTPFIEAAKKVQDKFAAERDEEFRKLLADIRAIKP